MALDPIVRALLDKAAAAGRPALSAGSPADARSLMASSRVAFGRGPEIDDVADLVIPTRAGSIPARLFRPRPEADGLVVFLHGGGWVIGTIEDYDAAGRALAQRSGCAVLMPDYRLAPETPFPGGLEDTLDALLWANARVAELAGAHVPLVVAGDSAGGNLAAVACAESRGRVAVALQVLIYPVVDCDVDTASYVDPANAGLVTRRDMIWFFDHYVGGHDRADPRVSPLRGQDLAGLPPAHVVSAEHDVLRDEGEAYARRLEGAGIPATLRRYDGMPHGFIRMYNVVPAADAALSEIAGFIGSFCRAQPSLDEAALAGATA